MSDSIFFEEHDAIGVKDGSPTAVAYFLGSFIDELGVLGVEDVVVSPGSRSTPLAMMFDASGFSLTVDIDERGAAFFALGLAKAKKRPVCLVCTSGTAVANYFPALLEARSSRIPLIVLTGDRPHELRGLGAPQTADQIKIFGDAVTYFKEMPVCTCGDTGLHFARQMAKEAYINCTGSEVGPVHLNFPFREPLKVDTSLDHLFTRGRCEDTAIVKGRTALDDSQIALITKTMETEHGVIFCGEGDYPASIIEFAKKLKFPLLADPLSNLRTNTDDVVIDTYDNIFRNGTHPPVDLVIRFGRYPVSKSAYRFVENACPKQIVVDPAQTRDFNADTTLFVAMEPRDFIEVDWVNQRGTQKNLDDWAQANARETEKISCVSEDPGTFEGPFVFRLFDFVPEGSMVFSASSMAIRAIDTFYNKRDKNVTLLCNRGINGIDGTLSSAIGAAQVFKHAFLVTGDLAMLHDINALHLQKDTPANLTIILFNNAGGGIFGILPQKSDQPYFEKLFLTPQDVDFSLIAAGFRIPYTCVKTVGEFDYALAQHDANGVISVIEIKTPLDDLKTFYDKYW